VRCLNGFILSTVAKQVAQMLNNTQMGGPKRAYYRYDLWNLKYLKSFKWNHLKEKVAAENAVRQQRIQAEIRQVRKETSFYAARVEQVRGSMTVPFFSLFFLLRKKTLTFFLFDEFQAKKIEAAKERLAKKAKKSNDEPQAQNVAISSSVVASNPRYKNEEMQSVLRKFPQRRAAADPASEQANEMSKSVLERVLATRKL
jgi:hypothetical protein